MRRKILIAVLGFGALVGYGSMFFCRGHHDGHYGPGGWSSRRAAFEKRVASVCAEAALEARDKAAPLP